MARTTASFHDYEIADYLYGFHPYLLQVKQKALPAAVQHMMISLCSICPRTCGTCWQMPLLHQSMVRAAASPARLTWRTFCLRLPERPTLTLRGMRRQTPTCSRYSTFLSSVLNTPAVSCAEKSMWCTPNCNAVQEGIANLAGDAKTDANIPRYKGSIA